MRKALIILFLIVLCIPVIGQDENWGKKIQWGTTFINTDSLRLREAGYVDSLYASGGKDTLYSDAFIMPEITEGIYGIAAFLEEVSGTSASIALEVRFGNKFLDSGHDANLRWEQIWHGLKSMKKDTLYRFTISPNDTSWFNTAADVRQYRLWEADADTVLPNVADYLR